MKIFLAIILSFLISACASKNPKHTQSDAGFNDTSDKMFPLTMPDGKSCMTAYSYELKKRVCLDQAVKAIPTPNPASLTDNDTKIKNLKNTALIAFKKHNYLYWEDLESESANLGDSEAATMLCDAWKNGRIHYSEIQSNDFIDVSELKKSHDIADKQCRKISWKTTVKTDDSLKTQKSESIAINSKNQEITLGGQTFFIRSQNELNNQKELNSIIDKILTKDSKTWILDKYIDGSVHDSTIIDKKSDYEYTVVSYYGTTGKTDRWVKSNNFVKVKFIHDVPQCIEYERFTGCTETNEYVNSKYYRSPNQEYINKYLIESTKVKNNTPETDAIISLYKIYMLSVNPNKFNVNTKNITEALENRAKKMFYGKTVMDGVQDLLGPTAIIAKAMNNVFFGNGNDFSMAKNISETLPIKIISKNRSGDNWLIKLDVGIKQSYDEMIITQNGDYWSVVSCNCFVENKDKKALHKIMEGIGNSAKSLKTKEQVNKENEDKEREEYIDCKNSIGEVNVLGDPTLSHGLDPCTRY